MTEDSLINGGSGVNVIEEAFSENHFSIENFLKLSISQGFSDIHLRVGSPPMARKDGLMLKSKFKSLTNDDMRDIVRTLVPKSDHEKALNSSDFDFSFEFEKLSRFRANLFKDMGNIGFVLRLIPINIPSIDSLYLPPVLKEFTTLHNGLILVTGPTGSGKSTTLASMLDYINQNTQKHIVTLEDPVEFVHSNKKCVFTQRQLGIDTDTFSNGLKYALRQDPDVILVGEMRDRETINAALKAAETGHLVFSTLHTTDAVQTINRIINAFEPHEREPIRLQIAATLRGTVAQKLVKKADKKGRVPALEVLVSTPAVKDYITKNCVDSIYDLVKSGGFSGMISMNMSLFNLVKAELITLEEALEASNTPNEMQQLLNGVYHGSF
ncbi:MAG: type IV pilus twitching motility protein PilT [bacterium]